jgi:hypothetical protein
MWYSATLLLANRSHTPKRIINVKCRIYVMPVKLLYPRAVISSRTSFFRYELDVRAAQCSFSRPHLAACRFRSLISIWATDPFSYSMFALPFHVICDPALTISIQLRDKVRRTVRMHSFTSRHVRSLSRVSIGEGWGDCISWCCLRGVAILGSSCQRLKTWYLFLVWCLSNKSLRIPSWTSLVPGDSMHAPSSCRDIVSY